MKIINILFVFCFMSILYSCSEDSANNSLSNNLPQNNKKGPYTKLMNWENAANPNNPYDERGLIHNQCLDYIVSQKDVIDTNDILNSINSIVSEFMLSKGIDQNTIDNGISAFNVMTQPDMTIEGWMTYNNLSSEAQTAYMNIIDMVQAYTDSTDIMPLIDGIKLQEEEIINSTTLTSQNKQTILQSTAVLRYSLVYWFEEEADPDSEWECVSIRIGISITQDAPWYIKVIGVGIADGLGALALGGWVGGIVTSGVTAIYLFWDDIGSAAGSVFESIGDGVESIFDFIFG